MPVKPALVKGTLFWLFRVDDALRRPDFIRKKWTQVSGRSATGKRKPIRKCGVGRFFGGRVIVVRRTSAKWRLIVVLTLANVVGVVCF